eukprot:9500194-Pyramimonas_sp.AAC.1
MVRCQCGFWTRLLNAHGFQASSANARGQKVASGLSGKKRSVLKMLTLLQNECGRYGLDICARVDVVVSVARDC